MLRLLLFIIYIIAFDGTPDAAACWYDSPKRQSQEANERKFVAISIWRSVMSGYVYIFLGCCKSLGWWNQILLLLTITFFFIGHFVRVYEGMVPMFSWESLCWSGDTSNTKLYVNNGWKLKYVVAQSHFKLVLYLSICFMYADFIWVSRQLRVSEGSCKLR